MTRGYLPLGLVLVTALAGCTRSVAILPPAHLLADCTYSRTVPRTNGELLAQRNERGDALDLCNADKEALRVWRDALPH